MTEGRVALVIVNHNTRDEVLACLASVADAPDLAEIVVVDSGSTDGTVGAVNAARPDVHTIALSNVGYGRAANVGVRATATPYVVVANADTRFDRVAFTALADALDADPTIGAIGPRVSYPDGRPQASARIFPTLPMAAGHAIFGLWRPDNPWTRAYRMLDEDPDAPRDVDWLSGCALAVRRTAFTEIDGFDPGYFMFVEDVDLGYRLRKAGWRMRYDPSARVVHVVGASTKGRPAKMVVEHAKSLDHFYGRVNAGTPMALLRPLVRLGLVAWVLLVLAWGAVVGRRTGRSSTGE